MDKSAALASRVAMASKIERCSSLIFWMRSCEPPLPDLGAVAARLHVSERTLNRRLQQEGTSFRQVRGELLNAWARQHLRETEHSVEAIAAALGYQDAANFRRAFRKQEGCSPGEFRRRVAV